ncbi:hypothetical protein CAPTEDRAFT_191048 [Capitella teleta]|uniref:Reverse transcriptase domain-containing protein n=1 Tax=Capitella teleta TaxID=283909 RepID=R7UWL6_CAPTE|nr:hypothetical protein CAPTEDRAFT_191048 [Capitella teleta]|eukprot:ELU10684.1 hypothetical protein CAPTEDRAFT_191048 [Capitella teleta]
MTEICITYAKEFHLTFNAKKTTCMKIGSARTTQDILRIDDQLVTWTDACINLGNKVTRFVMDDDDCALKASRFIGQVNRLLGNFGFLSSDVRSRLFTAYFTSFYGAQLWTLGSSSWTKVIVAWMKAVRRVLKLPYQTHTWLLPVLLGRPPLQCSLECRFVRFYATMEQSSNAVV